MLINDKPLRSVCAGLALMLASQCFAARLGAAQANQKPSPQEILRAAAENGRLMLEALRGYTYYTQLSIETVSQADTITGKYYRQTETYFDREGNRREKILETTSTLPKDTHIGATSADNLTRIYLFTITPEALAQYEFNYVGRERLDELSTYVFDVEPKVKASGSEKSQERYLRGRVWIDDQDLSVVKVAGEALPEQKGRRTPRFETYFINEGRQWFPAYSSADDRMLIDKYPARVIVKLRFTGYKKVKSEG